MHEKQLTAHETKVIEELEAELNDLQARRQLLDAERSELTSRWREIDRQLNEIRSPFKVGDIVVDETDTQFRVTRVTGSRPWGIRLNKNGAEAYKDARTIWSNELRLKDD